MSAINNVVAGTNYTPAATLNCLPSKNLTVQVSNGAVFYQLFLSFDNTQIGANPVIHGPHSAYYNKPGDSITGAGMAPSTEERLLLPGFWNFDQTDFGEAWCLGVQFRSASSTTPGTVTASN